MRRKIYAAIAAAGLVASAVFTGLSLAATHANAATLPKTSLGIYNGNSYNWPDNQKPDVANYYLKWEQSYPASNINAIKALGETPFVEIEPWENGTPQFSAISSGTYDSWLTSLGTNLKAAGIPVILTFAHEFNVSGQYPWSEGDTGSCGGSPCTPTQWIAAWDHVRNVVRAADPNAYFMWAPNADTGGSTQNPTPWWPGIANVDMIGVDGYPNTEFGSQFGTFTGEFGPVFSEIHKLSNLPIFISETSIAPLGTNGYESIPNFISDLFKDGGDGVLEFSPTSVSNAQWTQLDNALAAGSPVTNPTPTPTPTPTKTTPSPTPTPSPTNSGGGGCVPPTRHHHHHWVVNRPTGGHTATTSPPIIQ